MADVKPPVTAKPEWSCKISEPAETNGYTVGEVFALECSGPEMTLKEPLTAKLPEGREYTLVLLKPQQMTPNLVNYQVTSYRPGEWQFDHIDIVDAEGRGFVTSKLAMKVQSVIDPQKPPQAPFGPMGPMKFQYPWWVFFTPAVVFLVLVVWFMVFLRRRLQRKVVERNIKKLMSPLGSYNQFSKDLRALKRDVVFSEHQEWSPAKVNDFLQKLNEAFRFFMLREFIVPATTWPSRLVMRAIRQKDRKHYPKYRAALLRAFKELDRALPNPEALKSKDCEQLSKICWQAVDLVWKTKRETSLGGQR